jgi:hypothetical protein
VLRYLQVFLAALTFGSACAVPAPPPEAFVLGRTPQAEREMQTRVFATDDEGAVLAACIAVLERHGFAAEDQDRALGVIVAAKDATSDNERTRLRASLATQPAGEFSLDTVLRVTFQRLAWNARGRETKREAVREASEYTGFFEEVESELSLPEASLE